MAVFSPLVCVVAVALIDGASRVLIQKRPSGRQHGGLWEFPGGKIEQGEGPVAAVIREIEEELGLHLLTEDLFPVSFCATGPGSPAQVVLMLYGCRSWYGDPSCEDGASLEWVDIDALASRAMPPLDVPLAKALHAMLKRS
jgi:8-oxo-dGTP diphosphatase